MRKLNINRRELEATKVCLPIIQKLYSNPTIQDNLVLIGGYSVFFHGYANNHNQMWRGSHDLDFLILSQEYSWILDEYSTNKNKSHLPNKYSYIIDGLDCDIYVPDFDSNLILGSKNFSTSSLESRLINFKNSKVRVPKIIDILKLKLNIKNENENGSIKRRDKDIFDMYTLLNILVSDKGFIDKYGKPNKKSLFSYLGRKLDKEEFQSFKSIFRTYDFDRSRLSDTLRLRK